MSQRADSVTAAEKAIERDVRLTTFDEVNAWIEANPGEPAERILFRPTCADGRQIGLGSVLEKVAPDSRGDRDRGVVTAGPLQYGDRWWGPVPPLLGEIVVTRSPGLSTHSNGHATWRHVPAAEQTVRERYTSMLYTLHDDDTWHDDPERAADERRCWDVMALLPADGQPDDGTLDWPTNLYDGLGWLVRWIEDLEVENADLRAALGRYRHHGRH